MWSEVISDAALRLAGGGSVMRGTLWATSVLSLSLAACSGDGDADEGKDTFEPTHPIPDGPLAPLAITIGSSMPGASPQDRCVDAAPPCSSWCDLVVDSQADLERAWAELLPSTYASVPDVPSGARAVLVWADRCLSGTWISTAHLVGEDGALRLDLGLHVDAGNAASADVPVRPFVAALLDPWVIPDVVVVSSPDAEP